MNVNDIEPTAGERAFQALPMTRLNTLLRDLEIIADELRDEAMMREWCDDYGRFVDRVNARLSEPHLKRCRFTYSATFQVTVEYTTDFQDNNALDEITAALNEVVSTDSAEITGLTAMVTACERV